jgi:hypothetical protein
MAIEEEWIPTRNYSSRGGAEPVKLAVHATEGILRYDDLGYFFQGDVGASSHAGADNYSTVFGAYVDEDYGAWTQCNMNSVCLAIEQCAPSGASYNYSREYWLANYDLLLHNTARWLRHMSDKWAIPLVGLSSSQAQDSWTPGVCQHANFGTPGCNHGDCGPGYPIDKVLEWAWSGAPSGPPETPAEEDIMTPACARWKGNLYFTCIGKNDSVVYYKGPDTGGEFWQVDPGSHAIGGNSIHVDDDGIVISYINPGHAVCTYERALSGGDWRWADRGGQAK